MTKLPSDADLLELVAEGLDDAQIGAIFGATAAAVNRRLAKMGKFREPYVRQANQVVAEAWDILATGETGSHHTLSPAQSLRLWIRSRLGDTKLSGRQAHTAKLFEQKLRREDCVLDYSQQTAFDWVPRIPSDGDLAIRWPADRPAPTDKARQILTLPPVQGD